MVEYQARALVRYGREYSLKVHQAFQAHLLFFEPAPLALHRNLIISPEQEMLAICLTILHFSYK